MRKLLTELLFKRRYQHAASSKHKPNLQQRYMKLLHDHPVLTKSVTSAAIAGSGDFMCQMCFESSDFNWKRFGIFTFLGGVYIGPLLHGWYGLLGRYVPGTSTRAVMTRLVADQALFAPPTVASFFSLLLLLEGKAGEIPDKLQTDWWPTVQANWSVWIPAQFVNFRFIPANLQVLFANVVGLVWNSYLSYMSYRKDD